MKKPKVSRKTEEFRVPPLKPLTRIQARYIEAILHNEQTFAIGPAGTGRTYIASAMAAQAFSEGLYQKIILVRPAVEGGEEKLGYLPGSLMEKMAPWTKPMLDVLQERLGAREVQQALSEGRIEIAPFSHMRGLSFRDAFIILDEAQNTSVAEMKLFLTRFGEGSKAVVNGDLAQIDIRAKSGLEFALDCLDRWQIPNVEVVRFDAHEVVRHPLVAAWLKAFETA